MYFKAGTDILTVLRLLQYVLKAGHTLALYDAETLEEIGYMAPWDKGPMGTPISWSMNTKWDHILGGHLMTTATRMLRSIPDGTVVRVEPGTV